MNHGSAVELALERDREIAVLKDAVERTAERRGSLVAIEGPAGAGKTTLLTRAREQAAAAGLTVFSARGGELEGECPFGIVRQLFEGRLARAGDAEREAAFAGSASLARDPLGLGGGGADDDGRDRTPRVYTLPIGFASAPLGARILISVGVPGGVDLDFSDGTGGAHWSTAPSLSTTVCFA